MHIQSHPHTLYWPTKEHSCLIGSKLPLLLPDFNFNSNLKSFSKVILTYLGRSAEKIKLYDFIYSRLFLYSWNYGFSSIYNFAIAYNVFQNEPKVTFVPRKSVYDNKSIQNLYSVKSVDEILNLIFYYSVTLLVSGSDCNIVVLWLQIRSTLYGIAWRECSD
jgi:hypothetical protein